MLDRKIRTEIKKNLQAIEDVLNVHEEWQDEWHDYELTLYKDKILLDIADDFYSLENYTIPIEGFETDIKSICKNIIKYIYDNDINFRNDYVKDSKNYNNRKIKSLVLWSGRENIEKVNKINIDLIEHYKTIQNYNTEIHNYKSYVGDFYRVMWVLCPNFKLEDIHSYVVERFEYLNVDSVECLMQDNKIEVNYNNCTFSVTVDSYSNRNDVFTELYSKVKVLKEVA